MVHVERFHDLENHLLVRFDVLAEARYSPRRVFRPRASESINFLNAVELGVGVCGGQVVKPLAGRTESIGVRNEDSELRETIEKLAQKSDRIDNAKVRTNSLEFA